MKFVFLFLFLVSLISFPVCAAQKQIGNACASDANALDWDAIAQCNGSTFIKAPLMLGAVANPPYASTNCDSAKAGMIQYSGGAFQGCDGGGTWFNLLTSTATIAGNVLLGTSVSATNPHADGDAGTGLYSSAPSTVGIAVGGSNALYVTATGSVGIGTTTPNNKLQIAGGHIALDNGYGFVSAAGASLKTGPGGGTWSITPAASASRFSVNDSSGNSGFIIDASGSVGIGTTTPAYTLDVNGTAQMSSYTGIRGAPLGQSALTIGGMTTFNSQDGNGLFNIVAGGYQPTGGGGYVYTSTRGAGRLWLGDGFAQLTTSTLTAGTAGVSIEWNTGLVMTSTGSVGIGTSAPAYNLDISGTTRTTNLLATMATVSGNLTLAGAGLYNSSGYRIVETNATNWLRINPDSAWANGVAAHDNWAFGSGGVAIGGWTNPGAGNLSVTGNVTVGGTLTTGTLSLTNLTASGSISTPLVYVSNNMYLSYLGDWLSNRLGQAVLSSSAPTFNNMYLSYLGDWLSNRLGQAVLSSSAPTFADVHASNWFRVAGSGGIYWTSYGGGWNMTDTTWIRSYGSKPVYMASGFDTAAASGVSCGGGLGGGYTFRVCGTSHTTGNVSTDGSVTAGAGFQTNYVATGGTVYLFYGALSGTYAARWGLYLSGEGYNYLSGALGIGTTPGSYKLNVAGTAFASGAAGALSDARHKKDVKLLAFSGLESVSKLRPVSFFWKEPKDSGMKGEQFGFIAQEVEKILPQVVLTGEDEEKTKGLKYTEFVPILVKAVQELKAENDNLRARLEKLESQ